MTKFINGYTQTEMWVADERVEEYKAAGHKLAALPSTAIEPKGSVKKTKKKATGKGD